MVFAAAANTIGKLMQPTAIASGHLRATVYSNSDQSTTLESESKIDQAKDEMIALHGTCKGTDDTSWWLAYSRRLQEISKAVQVHPNPAARGVSKPESEIDSAIEKTIAICGKCKGTDDTHWWSTYSRLLQE